jgi:hypothetical protein
MENALDLGLGDVPAAPFTAKHYKGKPEYAPPYYTINVANVEHMPDFEVLGVNGEVLQVERGVNVANIPEAFVKMLRNAIASRLITKKNSKGEEFREWQPFPAIPYQIIEGPYQERKVQE